jgi:hypothetical protein
VFTSNSQISELLSAVNSLGKGLEVEAQKSNNAPMPPPHLQSKSVVRREDLKLICFDYLWQ